MRSDARSYFLLCPKIVYAMDPERKIIESHCGISEFVWSELRSSGVVGANQIKLHWCDAFNIKVLNFLDEISVFNQS